ncbi:hypothetical protein [Lapidilactobacillus salsurivasis]
MNRKLERNLVKILGIWQLIDGVITILLYGSYVKISGTKTNSPLNFQTAKALNAVFGSLYTFTVIFGVVLIGLGLLNLYFSKTYFRDSQLSYKLPIYLLCLGILAYFCMDIITVGLAMVAAVVCLAKNKSIKQTKPLN